MAINYHNPTIPTLNTDKVGQWKPEIYIESQYLGIHHNIVKPDYHPDHFLHQSVATVMSTNISSLPEELTATIICPGS